MFFFSFFVLIFVNIFLSLFLLIFFEVKCVVDRYKWHRPFQMATTVLRNGKDRLRKGNLPRRHTQIEFVGSLLCSKRFFSG